MDSDGVGAKSQWINKLWWVLIIKDHSSWNTNTCKKMDNSPKQQIKWQSQVQKITYHSIPFI